MAGSRKLDSQVKRFYDANMRARHGQNYSEVLSYSKFGIAFLAFLAPLFVANRPSLVILGAIPLVAAPFLPIILEKRRAGRWRAYRDSLEAHLTKRHKTSFRDAFYVALAPDNLPHHEGDYWDVGFIKFEGASMAFYGDVCCFKLLGTEILSHKSTGNGLLTLEWHEIGQLHQPQEFGLAIRDLPATSISGAKKEFARR